MKIKFYSNKFKRNYKLNDDKEKNLEKQIKELELKLISFRENKKDSFWIKVILEPIAKKLLKELAYNHYEISGPFGLCCETSIYFYKNENSIISKSISFIPLELFDKGNTLGVRDYSKNKNIYPKNSVGEMNGMNYKTIELDDNVEIKTLKKYIK